MILQIISELLVMFLLCFLIIKATAIYGEKKDFKVKLNDETILRKITEQEKKDFINNYSGVMSIVNKRKNAKIAENLYATDGQIIDISQRLAGSGTARQIIYKITVQLKDCTIIKEECLRGMRYAYVGMHIPVAFEKYGTEYRYRKLIFSSSDTPDDSLIQEGLEKNQEKKRQKRITGIVLLSIFAPYIGTLMIFWLRRNPEYRTKVTLFTLFYSIAADIVLICI